MTFYIENIYDRPLELFKLETMRNARRRIALYRKGPQEILLDNYLIDNYKISLKLLCLKILKSAKIMKDYAGRLVVVIKDNKIENFAKLITYGNGAIPGSRILRFAFCQDVQRRKYNGR